VHVLESLGDAYGWAKRVQGQKQFYCKEKVQQGPKATSNLFSTQIK
jgi:hypothetical protein